MSKSVDHRARVSVEFDLDFGVVEKMHPGIVARNIVQEVFRESFSRAQCVRVTVVEFFPT